MPQDWDYCTDRASGNSVLLIIERHEDINPDRAAVNRRAWCAFDVPCPKVHVLLTSDYREVTTRLSEFPQTLQLARQLLKEHICLPSSKPS